MLKRQVPMRGDRFLQHFRMLNMGVLRVFTKVTVFAAATQRVLGGDNLLHTHPPWKRIASWHWTKCSFENARPWRVYRNQAGLLEMALNRIISKVSRQKHEALLPCKFRERLLGVFSLSPNVLVGPIFRSEWSLCAWEDTRNALSITLVHRGIDS